MKILGFLSKPYNIVVLVVLLYNTDIAHTNHIIFD